MNNSRQLFFFYLQIRIQKRGTPHIHMLVWLQNMKYIDPHRLKATCPVNNAPLAYWAERLQCSSKSNDYLNKGDANETVCSENEITFLYTSDDENNNRRAYVDTVITSLKCHMDMQCSDGRGMLMKYVTSYVTKMGDHDIIYDSIMKNVSGYHIGSKYMHTLTVIMEETNNSNVQMDEIPKKVYFKSINVHKS